VVAMQCGGDKFVIPSDDFGLMAKKFDIDDMAEKITMLLDDRKLAKKISQNGRKHILKNFSIENVAEKIYRSFTQ